MVSTGTKPSVGALRFIGLLILVELACANSDPGAPALEGSHNAESCSDALHATTVIHDGLETRQAAEEIRRYLYVTRSPSACVTQVVDVAEAATESPGVAPPDSIPVSGGVTAPGGPLSRSTSFDTEVNAYQRLDEENNADSTRKRHASESAGAADATALRLAQLLDSDTDVVLVARAGRLASFADLLARLLGDSPAAAAPVFPQLRHDESHFVRSIGSGDGGGAGAGARRVVVVAGATDTAVLFGAYRFAEILGVWFSIDGDVPPDRTAPTPTDATDWSRRGRLPAGIADVADAPAFAQRGLQPFHDFEQGPDWWSADMYKLVAEQLTKMRQNFIGLHTYPVAATPRTGSNEPTVWVGLKSQVNADGTVTSAYPTSYANSLRGFWGNEPLATGNYTFGAAKLFEEDCFGSPVQKGYCPFPTTPEGNVAVIDATAAMLRDAFTFARRRGVKTCVGTETPLSTPSLPPGQLVPLQTWWSSERQDTFVTTTNCDECEGLYVMKGVTGYVHSAPASPASLPLSTWYNGAAQDNILLVGNSTWQPSPPPQDYGFVRVEGFAEPPSAAYDDSTALILELTYNTARKDHWSAASATDRAAAKAAGYTDVGSQAMVFASGPPLPTTQDWYEGIFTRIKNGAYPIDYYWIWTPEGWEWSKVNQSNPVFTDAVADLKAALAAHDAVGAPWQMATCGWVVGPLPDRTIFDKVLPSGYAAISSIDMDVGNTPVDPSYKNITKHAKWVIPWMEDDPGLTAPELWVNRTLRHIINASAYGCTGLLGIHWRTRQVSPQISAMAQGSWALGLDSETFWSSWATANFGEGGAGAAAVFDAIDSFNLPRPVAWVSGPGGLSPGQCGTSAQYAFVDKLSALAPKISGAANLARLNYWVESFRYMQAIAETECAWSSFAAAMKAVDAAKTPAEKKAIAQARALPARVALVANATKMMNHLLATVETPGSLGTIHNVLAHSFTKMLTAPVADLEAALGTALPPDAVVPVTYGGPVSRLSVPVARGSIDAGEEFSLRVLLLKNGQDDAVAPGDVSVTAQVRSLGSGPFTSVPLTRVAPGRDVFNGRFPSPLTSSSFEYYLTTSTEVMWPAGAPANTQTVVVA